MDIGYVIINRLDQLEANQAAIYNAAKRPTSWPMAMVLGSLLAGSAHFWAIPNIEAKRIPHLHPIVKQLKEWQHIAGTEVGLYAADAYTGETRRPKSQTSRFSMINLTENQTSALMKNLLRTESGGRYGILNRFCYLGAWQFGASALAQVGLVKRNRLKQASKGVKTGRNGHCQFLKNNNNWVISGGQTEYLRNHKMQDEAFIRLANFNILVGLKKRVLRRDSSASRTAGFVKAAHLIGSRRAVRWYKYGIDSQDGNGTKTSKYAKQGENSVKGIK